MEEMIERENLMSEEEYDQYIQECLYNPDGSLRVPFMSFSGVRKFKSIRRAIKRNKANAYGMVLPKRPFGNSKSSMDTLKRKIYEQLKQQRKIQ